MAEFRYEVGDTFTCVSGKREIAYRYAGVSGGRYYVTKDPLTGYGDSVREGYIDAHYTKIVPFFEVGKRYTRNGFEIECIEIYERKHRYALMLFNDNSLVLRNESDFATYREV